LIRERIGAHADLRNLWETADFQLDP
jgi:hypothetical protein